MTVRRDDKEPARYRSDLVIGREELFADARAQLARGGSVLLHGPAGIGKSTVLRALAAENAAATSRVLRCSATESESHLPFLALADLFGLVLDEVAPGCPPPSAPPWSRRSPGAASPPSSGTAWRCGSRSSPRCARCPPKARSSWSPTISSGSTRPAPNCSASPPAGLGDSPVRMLCAVRTAGEEYDRHLRACPPDTLAVRLGPFSRTQVSALLDHRGYTTLSRSTVRDIHRTSGGNPLFALELGRALAESPTRPRPGEPLPVPTSLRALVLSRLEMLSDEARRTLLVASAGARPTLALLHAAGRDNAEAETAQAASPRAAHHRSRGPGAALHAPADLRRPLRGGPRTGAARRPHGAVHRGLRPDRTRPAPGARLHRTRPGGRGAAGRGRRDGPRPGRPVGRRLPRTARRPAHPRRRRTRPDERRLQAAEDAITAGEVDLARDIAREVLTRATVPAERVRAWMVVIEAAGQALGEVDAVFPQVLADAGDDPGCSPWSTTSSPGGRSSSTATSRSPARRPRTRRSWPPAAGTGAPS